MLAPELLQRLIVLQRQGLHAELVDLVEELLRSTYDASGGLHELRGASLMALGRASDAVAAFSEAVRRSNSRPSALYNLGCALLEADNVANAEAAFQSALARRPDYAKALERLGAICLRKGDWHQAERYFASAIGLNETLAEAHDGRGLTAQRLGHFEEACTHHRRAAELAPTDAAILNNFGLALQNFGADFNAIPIFERALALKADIAETLNNYAISLEVLGHIEAARVNFGRAVAARPDFASAHRNLARLTRFCDGHPQLVHLEKAFAAASTPIDKAELGFALGKALDDIGRREEAFAHFVAANRLIRSGLQYDPADDEQHFVRIEGAYKKRAPIEATGNAEDGAPIFIVGMPRSGTSLAEQILASHSSVQGLGEIGTFGRLLCAKGAHLDGGGSLGIDDMKSVGFDYLGHTRGVRGDGRRITDKTPSNFLWVGAICESMPNAKIVHCTRDARDVCWSIFKHYFPNGGHGYAYDLIELGNYYDLYRRLMATWRARYSCRIYNLEYEALVADQARETRKLLEFCGLNFEAACLKFERTDRPVRTASAAQVRQALNDRSVGGWRRYSTELAPLIQFLQVRGVFHDP